jgi:hypothetical protein
MSIGYVTVRINGLCVYRYNMVITNLPIGIEMDIAWI